MPRHPQSRFEIGSTTTWVLVASLTVALGLAALVHASGVLAPTALDPNGPRIVFDATEWDFKEIHHKAPCEHVFKIKNTGKDTLRIVSAQGSCGCTVPTLSRKEIPSGGSEDLKVTYDSNRLGEFSKTVTVTSNDAVNPTVVLNIRGTITAEVDLVPLYGIRWMYPIQRDTLEKSTQRITLKTKELSELRVEKIEAQSPNLAWKVIDGPDARTKFVDLNLMSRTPIGHFNSTVTIHTNAVREPLLTESVYAEVVGDIEISPDRIYFPAGQDGRTSERKFTVRDRKAGGNFHLKEIKDAAGVLDFTTESVAAGREYAVTAKVKPSTHRKGNETGMIRILTDRAGEDTLLLDYTVFYQ
jgi:hypothetical protein